METIGQENVQLNPKQVNEILDLLDKEEILEIEEKIEKVLKKEQEQRQVEKEKDLAESDSKYNLKDNAQEIGKVDEEKAKKVSFKNADNLNCVLNKSQVKNLIPYFSPTKTKSTRKLRNL